MGGGWRKAEIELLVEDNAEVSYYHAVVFLASAILARGAGHEAISALEEVFDRTRSGSVEALAPRR